MQGTNISTGDIFGHINADNHLHFEEAEATFGNEWRNDHLTRLDPLRRMRGEDAGLDPAPTDNTDPVIEEAGLIHNAGDTTANWQPFPRLDADDPEAVPELEANDPDHDDTWVVWGSVEAWADAFDPRVNDSVDRALGVYSLTSDFSFGLDGYYYEYREGPPEVEIEGTLAEYLGDRFAYQTFDTVPGAVSASRQQLARHAFRDGSRISPTSFYYLLHNNPHGSQDIINDHNQPYEGMNRFWNTAEGIFDPEDNPNTSPLDMTLFAKYPDGPYNWEVTATDVAGNTDTHRQQVVVDNMLAVPVDFLEFSAGVGTLSLNFVFNSERTGVVISESDRNKDNVNFQDPSAGPFTVLLPGDINDESSIAFRFSEPIKNTITVDGNTKVNKNSILDTEIYQVLNHYEYTNIHTNNYDLPSSDNIGWKSGRAYRGNLFELGDAPNTRTIRISGVDYANNPLDYSPGTFSRRDGTGNFTDVSDSQYFEVECFFDYDDPEINSLSVDPDNYDVSFSVSDVSNPNFFTGGTQPVRVSIQWSKYYWYAFYSVYTNINLSLTEPTLINNEFEGDFIPRWLIVSASDASGWSTFQRYRISNGDLIPQSTMSVSGDSGSSLRLEKVSMLEYLLRMKDKGISELQGFKWNLGNISGYKAKLFSEVDLSFYTEQRGETLVVTPYFKGEGSSRRDKYGDKEMIGVVPLDETEVKAVTFEKETGDDYGDPSPIPKPGGQTTEPDYRARIPLAGADIMDLDLWTTEEQGAVFAAIREDTDDLSGQLPGRLRGGPGRELLKRTAIMLEFAGENGRMLGDTRTTTEIGDSFTYDLTYRLSEETTRMYHKLGLDTSAGSDDFYFYYADYYEVPWQVDESVDVAVDTRPAGGIDVEVAGDHQGPAGSAGRGAHCRQPPGGEPGKCRQLPAGAAGPAKDGSPVASPGPG
jgi:hypothetical protein